MEVSIGDRVFYTRSTGLWVPAKVFGLLHNGHVELECDQGGVRAVNHRCPMISISFGIPSLESPPHPHQFTQLTSLWKFFWAPLLMEAPFAVAPEHEFITFPSPRFHWATVNLGTESGKAIMIK